jgi:hypothetical protein
VNDEHPRARRAPELRLRLAQAPAGKAIRRAPLRLLSLVGLGVALWLLTGNAITSWAAPAGGAIGLALRASRDLRAAA